MRLARDRVVGMMYSLGLMDGSREADIKRLEEQLAKLENLADELERVPDAEVIGILDRAVALLTEVNAHVEAGLFSAEGEARELGDLLQNVDFGSFDAALKDLDRPPGRPDGS